ncbi:MAG: enoyl-CoA hydratase/isomerase family protein [Pseudomonadaceae bacterium]|nr:enoyl-CoA hydratase/isomerase family protein [Pseudomonadaceae bacterium]
MPEPISIKTFNAITSSPSLILDHSLALGCECLIVDCSGELSTPVANVPCQTVLIGIGASASQTLPFDLLVDNDDVLTSVCAGIAAQPEAAYVLTQVLRHNQNSNASDGLLAESLAYSTLQSGAGFKRWIETQPSKATATEETKPLLVERHEASLFLTLNRPAVHNAYDTALKDALCEALELVHSDPSISTVSLAGNGASFCAGGDLSEFGSFDNPATAHLSRTTRSAGRLLSGLTINTQAYLHGACIGAGIELPAFCNNIEAHPDTFFQLPEVAMGLIPGAGGTVSVLQRIGRQKTALMAISHQRVDAQTALRWGLIDSITSQASFHNTA